MYLLVNRACCILYIQTRNGYELSAHARLNRYLCNCDLCTHAIWHCKVYIYNFPLFIKKDNLQNLQNLQ